jgi:four helix bundle protein
MKVTKFEELIAWQKAQDLAVIIYQTYAQNKDWGFKDQIQRASVSVSNNVAEGFDRGTDPDFIRFLNFSRTSCNEVKSMTYLAYRLNYIEEKTKQNIILLCEEISRIILGLIKSLNKKS